MEARVGDRSAGGGRPRIERVVVPIDAPHDAAVVDAVARLRDAPGFAALTGTGPRADARWSILAAWPIAEARIPSDARPGSVDPFDALRRLVPPVVPEGADDLPFAGGVIAHLSYDLRIFTEKLPDRHVPSPDAPLLVARLYGAAVLLDRDRRECSVIVVRDSGDADFDRKADTAFLRLLDACRSPVPPRASFPPPTVPRFLMGRDAYRAAFDAVRAHLFAGDVYQVNLTHPVEGAVSGGATALFERLVAKNPSPFGGLFHLGGDAWIVSGSPERFLETRGRFVRTRPIKGTAARHADPAEDRRRADALVASEKDRAELAMIVDLLRNDLARTCEPGSVVVEDACALETHPTVHHLVATVAGRLADGRDVPDLLARAWPGGSISGVPKIRALGIIDTLETGRRGPYTGSLGYLSLHGRSDWNLLIRSAHVVGETAVAWVGGGITVMSDADAEWRETLHKLGGLAAAAPWVLPESGS